MIFGICAVIAANGCGSGQPLANTMSVDGTLSIDGKPFGPAAITFSKMSDPGAGGLQASADAQGKFDSIIYPSGSGAPEGLYQVIVSSDPSDMSLTEVPVLKHFEVNIAGSDGSVKIELMMESDRSGKMSAGPDPESALGSGSGAGLAPAGGGPAP